MLNAIGGHHADIRDDAVHAHRDGGRRDQPPAPVPDASRRRYIKRLEQLEGIATDQPYVDEAHAIKRVARSGYPQREQVDDAAAHKIARDIAKQVEDEMTFPGEIKVTVLREVRARGGRSLTPASRIASIAGCLELTALAEGRTPDFRTAARPSRSATSR